MRRIAELDGLRGLAALSIVLYHIWFPTWFMGWTRVDLFFVLSGFLVTSVILKRMGSEGFLVRFLVRRLIRLLPIYFVGLAGLVLINPFLPHPAPMEGLGYYATLTQNVTCYWGHPAPAFTTHFFHTWSLALEFRFYLVWPLLVLAVGRRGLPALCLATIATGVLGRLAGYPPEVLLGRVDGLALGGLLAALFGNWEWVTQRRRLVSGGLGAVMLVGLGGILAGMVLRYGVPYPSSAFTILAVCLAYCGVVGLTVLHAGHPAVRWLRDPRVLHLGTISYSLYLFHPLVIAAVELVGRQLGLQRGLLMELAMIPLTILVAHCGWRFVEKPSLDLLNRMDHGRQQPSRHPLPVVPAS